MTYKHIDSEIFLTDIYNSQNRHWEKTFSENRDMFGVQPSFASEVAVRIGARENSKTILELGAGQGRDAIYFAKKGFAITALDYSLEGLSAIEDKAKKLDLDNISIKHHDIRKALPFKSGVFDLCYAHMLLCMALRTAELQNLANEVRRILKPFGLFIYTARNIDDPHYKTGIDRQDEMYESSGFIVHFFKREMIDNLSEGFEIIDISKFEEGGLPRRLYLVIMKKI